jgi:hypothetical protein
VRETLKLMNIVRKSYAWLTSLEEHNFNKASFVLIICFMFSWILSYQPLPVSIFGFWMLSMAACVMYHLKKCKLLLEKIFFSIGVGVFLSAGIFSFYAALFLV